MLIYATADDLADWVTVLPDAPGPLLRAASVLVAKATRHDLYRTEPSGLPEVGSDAADALRDAVCVQVAEWLAAGVDPTAGAAGQAQQVTASSIGGASVSYAAADTGAAATHLGSLAHDVLRNAGLGSAGSTTWAYGPYTDYERW